MSISKQENTSKLRELVFLSHLCDYCGCCVAVCPVDCIELEETSLMVDFETCTLCGNCPLACPVGALRGKAA